MIIDLSKLRILAEAAKLDPYDNLVANTYGISMPPAKGSELIAEIERHREVIAEGCKAESRILLAGLPCAGAAPCRGLDEAEGRKPDYNTHPTTSRNTKAVDRPTQACQENQA
ncbi:hypothetical protein [Pseudomonas sp. F16(2018)]|uniref:hypothetical protein n=1 Tax=Pseudomonas sp. F16(2018) TaxID=2093746 RepID=UPI00111B8AB7|nr:hypothetical protein [Pseudomonas sp. F16(2018)]